MSQLNTLDHKPNSYQYVHNGLHKVYMYKHVGWKGRKF